MRVSFLKLLWLLIIITIVAIGCREPRDSKWVYRGVTGRLVYVPDAEADRIPDFSDVGYYGGKRRIPSIPTKITVSPISGDNTAQIQAAIDEVSQMPFLSSGYRGAVQLTAGRFNIYGQLRIDSSGIVLRGAGRDENGAELYMRGSQQRDLIMISGSGGRNLIGNEIDIIEKVVPVGMRSFRVSDPSEFTVGDVVLITRPSPANWIGDIGMDALEDPWSPGSFNLEFDRIINRIEGDRIFVDAPLTNSFEQQYDSGSVQRYIWPDRIENIGVENILATADDIAWAPDAYATSVAFGDIDGDSRDEIGVTRYQTKQGRVRAIINDDAKSNFAQLNAIGNSWAPGSYATSIAFGDVDGDGRDEIGVTRYQTKQGRMRAVIFDDAEANFVQLHDIGSSWAPGSYATSIAFGDVDGDGRDEIGVTRYQTKQGRMRAVIFDDAEANFVQLHDIGSNWAPGSHATSIAFGNVDRDGRDEIGLARYQTKQGRMRAVIFDDAEANFAQLHDIGSSWAPGSYATSIAFGNVDQDGRDEIGLARYQTKQGRVRAIIFDDARANFEELKGIGSGWAQNTYATSLAFGDVDDDGRDEIGVTRYQTKQGRVRAIIFDDARANFTQLGDVGSDWVSGTYATSMAFGNINDDRSDEFGITRYANNDKMRVGFYYYDSNRDIVSQINLLGGRAANSLVGIDKAQNIWVRNSKSVNFSFAAVHVYKNAKWVTVDDVVNWNAGGPIEGGYRYSFDLSGQLELVTNSLARFGRHDFVNSGRLSPGPHVFHRSKAIKSHSDSGPHKRWSTGSLFDRIAVEANSWTKARTFGNLNIWNRGDKGTSHGWAGANMVIWNCYAVAYKVQNPPTAQNWLIGSKGAIKSIGQQGYYDSHDHPVYPGSLYEAQKADAADISYAGQSHHIEHRDYLIGDIDSFVYNGGGTVDRPYINPDWQSAIEDASANPVTGLDDLNGNRNVAFTIKNTLDLLTREKIVGATLALALRKSGSDNTNDIVRLFDFDPAHRLSFAQLGWSGKINDSDTFVGVIDLGMYLDLVNNRQINVFINGDISVDWALYMVSVATPYLKPPVTNP